MMIDYEEFAKKFGKKIKNERIKRELSQGKLAKLSGLHRATIGQIENGKSSPTIDTIEKIANGLNLTLPEMVDLNF